MRTRALQHEQQPAAAQHNTPPTPIHGAHASHPIMGTKFRWPRPPGAALHRGAAEGLLAACSDTVLQLGLMISEAFPSLNDYDLTHGTRSCGVRGDHPHGMAPVARSPSALRALAGSRAAREAPRTKGSSLPLARAGAEPSQGSAH